MTPLVILICIAFYFLILLAISYITTRKVNQDSYFIGNKSSKWYVVAFGMLGDSLSGVTFISVPGAVLLSFMGYFQVVLGYFIGYFVIIYVLLPLYYRMNLTSIYSYLGERYGRWTEYTGAFFFLLSRMLGAAARLYLAALVLQLFIFDSFGVPFWLTVAIIITLIWLYTTKGGIKTLVWTDAFQSSLLIFGVVFSIVAIGRQLNAGPSELVSIVQHSPLSQIFFWDVYETSYFWKQFLGGAFIAICMTGLDQNMMQKNLSCKTLGDSQKNIFWFSVIMVITNFFFISLGVLLYYYADIKHIDLPLNASGKIDTDKVFPFLALSHLGFLASISFIVGLTAATFSSADSVLTTLTTSFYIDILHKDTHDDKQTNLRKWIHLGFAFILLLCILIIKAINTSAVIDIVLKIANYTYGPLLGLFAFGVMTKLKIKDKLVPFICILSPLISYWIDTHPIIIDGHTFKFGNTMLIINGLITFFGLFLLSLYHKNKLKNN